jgi:hypothetical protein
MFQQFKPPFIILPRDETVPYCHPEAKPKDLAFYKP